MEEKKFRFGNVCGDRGLITPDDEWVIENVNSITDLEKNWDTVLGLLNQQQDLINDLYAFRLIYNALLFNEWVDREDIEVYKSRRHHDGEVPFGDADWFIVVAILPFGKQVTNHYHIDFWDYFSIPEYDMVKDEFDGHTSADVLDRLTEFDKKHYGV